MAGEDLSKIENTVDVWCLDDFLPHMPEVRGRIALAHRLVRRWTCPRGRIPWLPNDGTDLRQYLLSHARPADIAQAAKSEALKDEQVEDIQITVEVLDSGRQLNLAIEVTDADGPFVFTLNITEARVTLIGLEREAA
jgi:hypothetical protein